MTQDRFHRLHKRNPHDAINPDKAATIVPSSAGRRLLKILREKFPAGVYDDCVHGVTMLCFFSATVYVILSYAIVIRLVSSPQDAGDREEQFISLSMHNRVGRMSWFMLGSAVYSCVLVGWILFSRPIKEDYRQRPPFLKSVLFLLFLALLADMSLVFIPTALRLFIYAFLTAGRILCIYWIRKAESAISPLFITTQDAIHHEMQPERGFVFEDAAAGVTRVCGFYVYFVAIAIGIVASMSVALWWTGTPHLIDADRRLQLEADHQQWKLSQEPSAPWILASTGREAEEEETWIWVFVWSGLTCSSPLLSTSVGPLAFTKTCLETDAITTEWTGFHSLHAGVDSSTSGIWWKHAWSELVSLSPSSLESTSDMNLPLWTHPNSHHRLSTLLTLDETWDDLWKQWVSELDEPKQKNHLFMVQLLDAPKEGLESSLETDVALWIDKIQSSFREKKNASQSRLLWIVTSDRGVVDPIFNGPDREGGCDAALPVPFYVGGTHNLSVWDSTPLRHHHAPHVRDIVHTLLAVLGESMMVQSDGIPLLDLTVWGNNMKQLERDLWVIHSLCEYQQAMSLGWTLEEVTKEGAFVPSQILNETTVDIVDKSHDGHKPIKNWVYWMSWIRNTLVALSLCLAFLIAMGWKTHTYTLVVWNFMGFGCNDEVNPEHSHDSPVGYLRFYPRLIAVTRIAMMRAMMRTVFPVLLALAIDCGIVWVWTGHWTWSLSMTHWDPEAVRARLDHDFSLHLRLYGTLSRCPSTFSCSCGPWFPWRRSCCLPRSKPPCAVPA